MPKLQVSYAGLILTQSWAIFAPMLGAKRPMNKGPNAQKSTLKITQNERPSRCILVHMNAE